MAKHPLSWSLGPAALAVLMSLTGCSWVLDSDDQNPPQGPPDEPTPPADEPDAAPDAPDAAPLTGDRDLNVRVTVDLPVMGARVVVKVNGAPVGTCSFNCTYTIAVSSPIKLEAYWDVPLEPSIKGYVPDIDGGCGFVDLATEGEARFPLIGDCTITAEFGEVEF